MKVKESNSYTTMKAIIVLFLLPLQLFSQDLSGIWKGTISTSQTQMPFELAINQDMTGYSMITFMFKGAEKTAVKKITLVQKDSTYTISDDKVVYNNFTVKSRSIKTFCELSVKMVDSTMVLSGPFHTRTRDLRAGDEDLSSGTITLQKQNVQAKTRLITKLDSLKLSNTLAFSIPKETIKEVSAAAPSKAAPPVAAAAAEKAPPAVPAPEKTSQAVATSEKASPVMAAPEKASPAVAAPVKAPLVAAAPKKESPIAAAPEKAPTAAVENPKASKPDSSKWSNTLASSNPKPTKKADPIVAAPVKASPAVAAPEKGTPAVATSVKAPAIAAAPEKASPPVAAPKKEAPAAAAPEKDLAAAAASKKAPLVVSAPEKATPATTPEKATPTAAAPAKAPPAAAGTPEKDVTAVKVNQQVSSVNEKNGSSAYAPTNIAATSALPVSQKVIDAAAEVASRKTEVIRTIEFKSDSLTLTLYDNGIVDGDTVSVVLNNEVIIPKLGLTDQAYRKVIKIPPGLGDTLQLVIYAENLGSIPPNSGLLIVEDGSDRQKVGFEGDMTKSSAVRLRRVR